MPDLFIFPQEPEGADDVAEINLVILSILKASVKTHELEVNTLRGEKYSNKRESVTSFCISESLILFHRSSGA